MLPDHLSRTFQLWIEALDSYDESLLLVKPADDSWSIGQVYVHLIKETTFFLSQVRLCLSSEKNSNMLATPQALEMLANNSFPNQRIEGPPSNLSLPQPLSKDQILQGLEELNNQIEEVQTLFKVSSHQGKSRHPGLGYFNAHQWYQFAEMHLRHHVRQKKRIDTFLGLISSKDDLDES